MTKVMAQKVVDASALAAVCFSEPEGASVATRFLGAQLVSTTLLEFELANICWKRTRRAPSEAQRYRLQFLSRKAMAITIVAVPLDEVVGTAVATNLTAYDASYLWLARHLGAELITLDKRLDRVARAVP